LRELLGTPRFFRIEEELGKTARYDVRRVS
jgi:hypothetical protein